MKTIDDIGWEMRVLLGTRARQTQWLKARIPRVTGSVYGAICGVSGYHTIFDLYQIKRGEKKPSPAGWNARRGTVLEPEIRAKAAADVSRPWAFQLLQTPKFVQHPAHDLIACSPDFLAFSTDPVLCEQLQQWPVKILGEIKSRDGTKASNYRVTDDWPGYTPAEESQVRFNMLCTGADVGLLVVQCLAEETIYRVIHRDPDVEAKMVDLSLRFLKCCETGDTDDLFEMSETAESQHHIIRDKFDALRPATLDVDNEDIDQAVARLVAVRWAMKDLKAEETSLKAQIGQAFEDFERIETDRYICTWKAGTSRKTFDTSRLLSVFPGMNLQPYYKHSTPRGRGTLTVREKETNV